MVQRKKSYFLESTYELQYAGVSSHCQSWITPQQKQGTSNLILPSVTLKEDCGKLFEVHQL